MNTQQQKLKQLAKKYHLKFVLLFGSAKDGKNFHKEKSDFDIAILSQKKPNHKEYIELLAALSKILRLPSQRIDLSSLNHADPLFLFEATRDAKLLLGDQREFNRFRVIALKKYLDHQKFFRLQEQYLLKQLYA